MHLTAVACYTPTWTVEQRIEYAQQYLRKNYTLATVPPEYVAEYEDDAVDLDIWSALGLSLLSVFATKYSHRLKREIAAVAGVNMRCLLVSSIQINSKQ